MYQFKFTSRQKALVIIAHPDDETIWLSGTIMLHPEIDWTVLCLSRSGDTDRAPKFARVAERLNFTYFHEDLDDLERYPFLKHVRLAKNLIKKNIGKTAFDFVITHGANGEYGHRDHKSIHEAVADLAARGLLKTDYILYLHYKKPKRKIPLLIPREHPDLIVNLPEKIYLAKKLIMSDIYGFAPDGIDANYCTKVEAFKIKSYN